MGNGKTSIQKLAPKIQLNNQIQLKLDNDGMYNVHTSVRPPEMRGKKSKLRCLWMVPQAVEVKGRIKNRKRWRYLTEQAHSHTHQYWLNWCLPHESHQFYYVTSRSRGSFWHSVQSSSMSKDIFCRTCEHDLFCSLPPFFFPSRVDDCREEEVPQSEPESLF